MTEVRAGTEREELVDLGLHDRDREVLYGRLAQESDGLRAEGGRGPAASHPALGPRSRQLATSREEVRMSQALALALTLAIEVPIVVGCGGLLSGDARGRALWMTALGASLLTHPFAWAGWHALIPHTSWWLRALVVEGAVVAVEAGVFRWSLGWSMGRAAGVSALANGASFGLGLLMVRLAAG